MGKARRKIKIIKLEIILKMGLYSSDATQNNLLEL